MRIIRKEAQIKKFEKYGCKELAAFNNKPSLNYKQSTNTEIVELLIKDKNSHYYEDQDGR